MAKYIINHHVDGYESAELLDKKLDSGKNSIVIVLDEHTNDKLLEYYTRVRQLILSGNKLYLIILGKTSEIRMAIACLFANYENYNIYKVDNKSIVTKEYIEIIEERQPTIDEVGEFISGNISAFADMSVLVAKLKSIASDGNMGELQEFVNEHIKSIDGLVGSMEYIKNIVDTSNSGKLFNRIEELKANITKLDVENKNITEDNIKLQEMNDAAKRAISKMEAENKNLKSVSQPNSPIIQTYSELNTSLIQCKVNSIIYFKEISYVAYTNTLIMMLLEVIKMYKKRVKLIIYDNKVGLSTVYKPLSVLSGGGFLESKDNFVSNVEAFVVVEPNPMIISSILENTNPKFDVVIVYDRMRQATNLISGNNVSKFYIVNSQKDFKEVRVQLKINDTSSVITRVGSTIAPDALNIPYIQEFNSSGTTSSARIAKYNKLLAQGNNKPIIGTILEKSRVSKK